MSEDKAAAMRMHLANAGIFLEEAAPAKIAAARRPADAPIDRARIREILVAAGAPERDLDWMTASCPTIEHALAYRPTIRGPV